MVAMCYAPLRDHRPLAAGQATAQAGQRPAGRRAGRKAGDARQALPHRVIADRRRRARRKIPAARFAVGLLLLDNIRPPEILVPGHKPNHDAKCFALGHRVMSVPISAIKAKALPAAIPSLRVKSTPYTW